MGSRVSGVGGAIALLLTSTGWAQDQQPAAADNGEDNLTQVVVTGSLYVVSPARALLVD